MSPEKTAYWQQRASKFLQQERTASTLLNAVATQLLGTPLESFDAPINDALSRLVEFNGVERSTLSLVDPDDGMVLTTWGSSDRLGPTPGERRLAQAGYDDKRFLIPSRSWRGCASPGMISTRRSAKGRARLN
jgi:hypothetical protein